MVMSEGISERLPRRRIHHGYGSDKQCGRMSYLSDKENRRRIYALSTLQGTARPRNLR